MGEIPSAFDEDAGVGVLPPVVQEMAAILGRQDPACFALSPSLTDDALITQRATEFLYPLRVEPNCSLHFFTDDAEVPDYCTEQDAAERVVSYLCREPATE